VSDADRPTSSRGSSTPGPAHGTDTVPNAAEIPIRDGLRRVAVTLAALRYVVPLLAIPLIPVLIIDRLPLLVLLRPQKEFLLLGGGQNRVLGDPAILLLFAAYVPLMIVGVWAFFIVGRVYRGALRDGQGPAWLHRAIPPRQLEIAQAVLARRGPSIAVFGRLAALPPTMLAAAAGTSDVDARRYLAADLAGGIAAFATTVAAGYALGRAYEDGGVWLTAAGVGLFVALIVLLTRWLRAEARRYDAQHPAEAPAAAGE
jgi:membrane protein DedA with SNARE-associated domain